MCNPTKNVITVAALLGGLGVAAGCGPSAPRPDAARATPPVAVETAPVVRRDLERAVEVVGSLGARRSADVKPEYPGVVSEVFVSDWVHVTRGTPLARLDLRESRSALESARSATLQAQVAADRSARELERTSRMRDAGLATQQALDEARTAAQAASAGAAAARAQQALAEARLDKATLRAPIDGTVYARNVNVGDLVDSGGGAEPAFKIVDVQELELVVTVPSGRSAELALGQPLLFETDADAQVERRGAVSHINPEVDEASRTVKVKVAVPNRDGALRPGLFVRGRIVTGQRRGVVLVPRAALASWDPSRGTGAVFVCGEGTARWRSVRTGAVAGDEVEVVSGLEAGERVATRGAFNLHDGDRVASTKEG